MNTFRGVSRALSRGFISPGLVLLIIAGLSALSVVGLWTTSPEKSSARKGIAITTDAGRQAQTVDVCSGAIGYSSVRSTKDLTDDTRGYAVHVMYVLPSDGVDHHYDTNGAIARSVSSWEYWLCGQTGGKGLKLDTRKGKLDVTFVRLNATDNAIMTGADSWYQNSSSNPYVRDDIEARLRKLRVISSNKLYAIYYDGHSNWSCGGGAWPPTLPGQVAAEYMQGGRLGDVPCENNQPIGTDPTAPGYLDFDILHELMHTLGLVPSTAPHLTLAGHVSDTPTDLMWAGNQPWGLPNLVLDYGNDDYYKANIPNSLDLSNSIFFMGGGSELPPKWGQSSNYPLK